MKTVVTYYSLSGTCRKLAEERARTQGVPCIAVEEARRRSMFAAYTVGSFQAMRQKAVSVKPISDKITNCDRIVVYAPVWAGMPAPAFNSLANALHSGQEVEVVLVPAGARARPRPACANR